MSTPSGIELPSGYLVNMVDPSLPIPDDVNIQPDSPVILDLPPLPDPSVSNGVPSSTTTYPTESYIPEEFFSTDSNPSPTAGSGDAPSSDLYSNDGPPSHLEEMYEAPKGTDHYFANLPKTRLDMAPYAFKFK